MKTLIAKNAGNKSLYYVLMIIAMLFWGVAWTAGKIAAEHSNAEVSAFWRYAISFAAIIPIVWILKTPKVIDKISLVYTVAAGLLTSFFNYLFFAGLSHGQAGYGGTMVTALSPLFTYLLAISVFKTTVSIRHITALSVGFLGALILLRVPYDGFAFLSVESSYFLGCAVVWSIVTVISQKATAKVDPMFYTLIVFGVTCLSNMVFALPHRPFDLLSYDATFWQAIIFIGVVPGAFSTALFFLSAKNVGAHKTAAFMFIVPVGAIVSSAIVYQESVAMSTIVGCLLAFVAVVMFNYSKVKDRL